MQLNVDVIRNSALFSADKAPFESSGFDVTKLV